MPFNLSLQWVLLKLQLAPAVVSLLSTPRPLGVDEGSWAAHITAGLYSGHRMIQGSWRHWLLEELRSLETMTEDERQQFAEQMTASAPPQPGQSDFSARLLAKVDCHEFSPNEGGVNFVAGALVAGKDPSVNNPFDRPYDSAKFQITAPIYYLTGTAELRYPRRRGPPDHGVHLPRLPDRHLGGSVRAAGFGWGASPVCGYDAARNQLTWP